MTLESFSVGLLKFVVAIAGSILGCCYSGLILSHVWNWFISPLGVREITIPMAIGISLVLNYPFITSIIMLTQIRDAITDSDNGKFTKFMTSMITSAVCITIVWGIGAIIHTYFIGS